ncbi:hypothetical protein B0H16DRAFT_1479118 [Mycena metata]|uniref:NB-ARC domain-containing protein n=1 Tax=Mycena metata TaxID=1033252 RepID=A0AAD7MEK6_9AGAR|nr:hypothetical protein B0H16DRAFT_1479118 [Mycena metata]
MLPVVDMLASQGRPGIMFSLDGDSRSLYIIGGQGGPGGQAHLQGGTGGAGQGPIVHITTPQLIAPNLHATLTTDQALRLQNVQASQIASHCPPPSRIFCGRQDILDKMHQFFSDTGIQHTYVLHGLGGAGKTQIALKFINESSARFPDIFFIDTSTIVTIETGLKNIAILKDFGNSPEDGLLWLTSKCNHGNIIITSRTPGMCVYAGSNSLVTDMEEEDAVTLLLKSAFQKATVHTEEIVAEIVKAGAFLSKSQNLDGYLALYMKNQTQLLSQKPAQSHDCYAWKVYTMWQMSFDQLTPPAAIFLQHCSFLHYTMHQSTSFVPMVHLKKNYGSLGNSSHIFWGQVVNGTLSNLSVATNEVQSYSLISFDAEKQMDAEVALAFRSQYTQIFWEGGNYKQAEELQREVLEKRKQYSALGEHQKAKELRVFVLEKRRQVLGHNHPDTLEIEELLGRFGHLEHGVGSAALLA